jgi:WD40 repeat protein
MTPSEQTTPEDDYAALLAAADEALTTSSELSLPSAGSLPPDVRRELERDLACIELLRRALPRRVDPGHDTLDQPHPPADAGAELPWSHLGRFQILRELGRGGFGVVYLANDPRLGRTVALKVPQGHALTDIGLRSRFQREARAAAGLEHANLVPVYDAGEIGPLCYIASAYCPGPTLARWLKVRDGPVPFRQAAVLVAQLAEGVDHAHHNGVVHRDLKPGNVLLSPVAPDRSGMRDGKPASADDLGFVPRVTDFGLARFICADDGAGRTRTNALMGTPAYMAPEQAGGQGREAGPPTDVYALGAILYELLTGRPPFQAESAVDTLVLVRTEEPVRPARLRPKMPRDLETICLRAMAKAPARRYASAGAFAADLRRWLRGEPILARPVGTWERAVKWARRRPAVAALSALTVLVALLGLAGVTSQWRRAEATATELERRLYFHLIAKAATEMAANNMRLADELLDACPLHLRGWEWHYVRRLRYGARPPLFGHKSAVHAVAVHPNGRLLASAGEDSKIKVWDLTNNVERSLDQHTKQVRAVRFSPDGRYLASAGLDGRVIVRSTDDWRKVRDWEARGQVGSIAFHPNSRRVAWRDWDNGKIMLGEIDTNRQIPTRCVQARHSQGDNFGIAFSGDGLRLAGTRGNMASGDGEVLVWDMEREVQILPLPGPMGAFSVDFSSDGRLLAAGGGRMWRGDSEVKVWDARTGEEKHCLLGTSGMVVCVTFSPDGRRLATAGRDKIIKLWDVETGMEALALHGHADTVRALAFSHDGKCLISGSSDHSVRIWDATPLEETPRPETATLTGRHAGRLSAVAYRPDGQCFASASLDGVVTIWDARTHEEILTLPRHDGGVLCVTFNRDGRLLASTCDDGTTRLWDARTWAELPAPPESRSWISSATFAPDDRLALTGALAKDAAGSTHISVWDAKAQKVLPSIPNAHSWFIQSVAFSPDGRWLASTGADGKVKVWNGATGEPVKEIIPPRKGRGLSVAFSPDCRRLAYAGLNQTVTILDTSTWNEVVVFDKHTDQVNGMAFSPDGRRVASASNDATVKVWNAATAEEIVTLRGHSDWVESVAFRPDGEELISGGWDRTVRVWKAPP